jgi:hypothetical protein
LQNIQDSSKLDFLRGSESSVAEPRFEELSNPKAEEAPIIAALPKNVLRVIPSAIFDVSLECADFGDAVIPMGRKSRT